MAAVENLSEVIKDNVKEHVSAAEKETSVENIKLYNGDTESERYVFYTLSRAFLHIYCKYNLSYFVAIDDHNYDNRIGAD